MIKRIIGFMAAFAGVFAFMTFGTANIAQADASQSTDRGPSISCTDSTSKNATPGDDTIVVRAGYYYGLTGQTDYGLTSCDLTANDGVNGDTNEPLQFQNFVESTLLGENLASFYGFNGTYGYSAAMLVDTSASGTFDFAYKATDNITRHVTVQVLSYIAPARPTITKANKRGFVKVVNPTTSNSGGNVTISCGPNRYYPNAFGYVPAGHTVLVNVNNHTLYCQVFDADNGTPFMVVKLYYVRLMKGEKPMPIMGDGGPGSVGAGKRITMPHSMAHYRKLA